MKGRLSHLLLVVLLIGDASSLYADSAVDETIKRLRDRGEYDAVLKYLDRIERDATVPAAIRKRIPYERAVTLIRGVRQVNGAKLQHKQLDRAAAYLGTFIKANPKHALAPDAKKLRGKIFIGKAQLNNIELQRPGNMEQKTRLRKTSLENIRKARGEFNSALPNLEKQYKSFGTFIPRDQVERRKKRQRAEFNYVIARIDLAKCTYTEAHAYDSTDKKFRELLTNAFNQFETIHVRYRSLGYGLYARLWQGKCLEEQGEIRRALGIYSELLSHKGSSSMMQMIQRETAYFRLICLNHKSKRDYQLVEISATEWWERNVRYRTTPTGLGVKYELARARMILGSTSKDIPPKDKQKYLTLAKADAAFVAKYPGEHQARAAMLLKQINRRLANE